MSMLFYIYTQTWAGAASGDAASCKRPTDTKTLRPDMFMLHSLRK